MKRTNALYKKVSAYSLFSEQLQEEFPDKNKDKTPAEIRREVSKLYKELPEPDKAYLKDQAMEINR